MIEILNTVYSKHILTPKSFDRREKTMKKTWKTPEIDALNVAETASGNIANLNPDGPAVYDQNKGSYVVTVGYRAASLEK